MNEPVCKYCGGTGQIRTKGRVKEFRGRKIYEEDASPCVCIMNKHLSERFKQLASVPDAAPEDAIKAAKRYARDTFKDMSDLDRAMASPSKRFEHRNLIFVGDETLFFYILKSYFLFFYKYNKFEFLEGLEVVQKYYVEQHDGTHRSLYDLNKFDLLVLSFTSKPNNVAMQDNILEVIKNRSNLNYPTWIYTPTIEGLTIAKEYSEPLQQYITNFNKCSVNNRFDYIGFDGGGQTIEVVSKKQESKKLANI